MLPDSMNVGVIAENIRALQKEVGAIPAGKIPKDYSTTETDTGLKWIDGSKIYQAVLTGNFPAITETATQTITGLAAGLNILTINGMCTRVDGNTSNLDHFTITYQGGTSGNVIINSVSATYSEGAYDLIVRYTKPSSH